MIQKTNSARFLDFWLLGGASIVAWCICALAELLRADYSFVEVRMRQIAPTFLLLTLLVNYPHFMSSYRMAYSKGREFYVKNWFALFLVPALLLLLFFMAFTNLQNTDYESRFIQFINKLCGFTGFGYRMGENASVGLDLLGISAWIMFLTVGWHYSKQIFGCVMVYANYDSYPISLLQRRIIKFCVFGVAFYSFCYLSFHWRSFTLFGGVYNLMGISITELAPPKILERLASLLVWAGIPSFLYFVVYVNYKKLKKWPSWNFLIPLLAFYIWWIPLFPQAEFYLMLVPFFHSLQYLAFSYRMEKKEVEKSSRPFFQFSIRTLGLLLLGFLVFEAIPGLLDSHLGAQLGISIFFTFAAMVFINIHHFFLDSILWRFADSNTRSVLLSATDVRRRAFSASAE